MENKKKVFITVTRTLKFEFEKNMTDNELKEFREKHGIFSDYDSDCDGGFIVDDLGGNISEEPDSFEDECEIEVETSWKQ